MDEILLKLLLTTGAFAAGWLGHVAYINLWVFRVQRRT